LLHRGATRQPREAWLRTISDASAICEPSRQRRTQYGRIQVPLMRGANLRNVDSFKSAGSVPPRTLTHVGRVECVIRHEFVPGLAPREHTQRTRQECRALLYSNIHSKRSAVQFKLSKLAFTCHRSTAWCQAWRRMVFLVSLNSNNSLLIASPSLSQRRQELHEFVCAALLGLPSSVPVQGRQLLLLGNWPCVR
jgi:hypothetical protein